jgi:Flp pilus assembly protein TadD
MVGMDGEACLKKAYDAILHGDFELALKWFRRAIELDPGNASYYYKASVTCSRSGKAAQAKEWAAKAVELAPEEPVYEMHLKTLEARELIAEARAILEAADPEPDQAIKLLVRAKDLNPLSAEASLLLGHASKSLGDFRSAIGYLLEALQLDPQHAEARRLLREWRRERRRLVKQYYHIYPN